MKSIPLSIAFVAFFGVGTIAQAAGDAQAGKSKAASCAGCHGPNGEGVKPNPPLAGMKEDQFIQAMKDYKSGKRPNAVMKGIAGQVDDKDLPNLAAYYVSLKKK